MDKKMVPRGVIVVIVLSIGLLVYLTNPYYGFADTSGTEYYNIPSDLDDWWNSTIHNILHGIPGGHNNTTHPITQITELWDAYEKCNGTDLQCQNQLLEALRQTVPPAYSSQSQPQLTQEDYQLLNQTTKGIHDWLLLPPNTYGFTKCENPKSPATIVEEKSYQDMKDKGLNPPDQFNPWPLLCSTPLDQVRDYFTNHP